MVSHVTTASPSLYPLNMTYTSNGDGSSIPWHALSTKFSRVTTTSLSPYPSNRTYAPNGDGLSTSGLAWPMNSSSATITSTSPQPMNMTYLLNGTNSTNSPQTLSTDPSLDGGDFCDILDNFADPTSCSCQALYNSYASSSFYTLTWTDSGGSSTITYDNGQTNITTVSATIKTYTDVPPTDCCQSCYLLAYHVHLLYWPIEDKTSGINTTSITDTASVLYTTVSNDFTLCACTPPRVVPN